MDATTAGAVDRPNGEALPSAGLYEKLSPDPEKSDCEWFLAHVENRFRLRRATEEELGQGMGPLVVISCTNELRRYYTRSGGCLTGELLPLSGEEQKLLAMNTPGWLLMT